MNIQVSVKQWTKEQLLAIKSRDGEVLLGASAGSGKTGVLAERCVDLLLHKSCEVDEMLVVTFTDAAAAEMRARIGKRLGECVRGNPGDVFLRRQYALLDKAHISTIHAFCMGLLREYFYELGIDGGFKVMDAEEARLLQLETARDLLEEYYEQIGAGDGGNDAFCKLVESYGPGVDDGSLVGLLVRLHNFLDTLEDRQEWHKSCEAAMGVGRDVGGADDEAGGNIGDLLLVQVQKQLLSRRVQRQIDALRHVQLVIRMYPELGYYGDYVNRLWGLFERLYKGLQGELTSQSVGGIREVLAELSRLPNLPRRPRGVDAGTAELVKGLLGNVKSQAKEYGQRYSFDVEEIDGQLQLNSPLMGIIVELQREFGRRYEHAKSRVNAFDFADLEHKALELLLGKDGGLSEVAWQLRGQFKYVMVDEYQDISAIQEKILQCVSRSDVSQLGLSSEGKKGCNGGDLLCGGNLFMVGDVKQSIYGFRQADPGIFLKKYHGFELLGDVGDAAIREPMQLSGKGKQVRIDLNKNFRSRRGVINGVNYIFGRCMTSKFGGVDYKGNAELVFGAEYYDGADMARQRDGGREAVQVHLIDEGNNGGAGARAGVGGNAVADEQEIDKDSWEPLLVSRLIKQMVSGEEGQERLMVFDRVSGEERPVEYRDIVILLRSLKGVAEKWCEVLRAEGIAVHAELSRGYFAATEVRDMITLLSLIDNPQQDVELAAILRSWIVGLDESQLAEIKLHAQGGCGDAGEDDLGDGDADEVLKKDEVAFAGYYYAVLKYMSSGSSEEIRGKLIEFMGQLDLWRDKARRGKLADLVWGIYEDTGMLAYVSGLQDGQQRHNNLLHLYDRAMQFDSFSYRGLAKFIRFIDTLIEEKGDFSPAPVLSEADNVVRIMSIHKSKGLEFPVVILAMLGKEFNRRDERQSVLLGRPEIYPLGLSVVDRLSRESWKTLSYNVVQESIKETSLEEELRLLYVAMTRARERLILVGRVDIAKRDKELRVWSRQGDNPLPEFTMRQASSAMDWLLPALVGHRDVQRSLWLDGAGMGDGADDGQVLRAGQGRQPVAEEGQFDVFVYNSDNLGVGGKQGRDSNVGVEKIKEILNDADRSDGNKGDYVSGEVRTVIEQVEWRYRHEALTRLWAHTSVTQMKKDSSGEMWQGDRQGQRPYYLVKECDSEYGDDYVGSNVFKQKCKFLSDESNGVDTLERGTLTHLFLQKLKMHGPLDEKGLQKQFDGMIKQGIFKDEHRAVINIRAVAGLFESELGAEMLRHKDNMQREWAFTLAMPVSKVYPEADLSEEDSRENVLLRGIIDCFYVTEAGVVIIDYKTDKVNREQCAIRAESYSQQLGLYKLAVEKILGKNVVVSYLYFIEPQVVWKIKN